jgi:prepilin-type N-terminal cleavage/methylation domain-containing protein
MKKQTGLTLIELMVTTIILVIMASVAVPSMKSFLDRGNRGTIGPIFEQSVKLARSEAIQRSQTVSITPISGTSDWAQGWRIETMDNTTTPATPILIRIINNLPGNFTFTGSLTSFSIRATGQANAIGSFTLSLPTANNTGCIGNIDTYNLLLSGLLSRSVTKCP